MSCLSRVCRILEASFCLILNFFMTFLLTGEYKYLALFMLLEMSVGTFDPSKCVYKSGPLNSKLFELEIKLS